MDDQYGQNYEDEQDDEDDNDECLTVLALQGSPYLSKESSQAESDLHWEKWLISFQYQNGLIENEHKVS